MNRNLRPLLFLWLFAIACLVVSIVVGCGNKNEEIKVSKESNTYSLPKGMKLVNVTDKSYNELGVLMRPMKKGEKAETYVWSHISGYRSVTIKEVE